MGWGVGGGERELLWNNLTKQKMTPWLVCFDFELGECVIKELNELAPEA